MVPKHLLRCAIVAGLTAGPVAADTCRDEIAALFDGGALDPFARPAHRQTVEQYDAGGALTRTGLNIFETPLKSIAGEVAAGHFTMAIDRDIWNGRSPDGPWEKLGVRMPEGREADLRTAMAQEAANLTDATCHGATSDGQIHYSYRTRTDPNADGMFYGALHDTFVDPSTGLPVRMVMTEFVNSWSDGVSQDRHVITFDYDSSITVSVPD